MHILCSHHTVNFANKIILTVNMLDIKNWRIQRKQASVTSLPIITIDIGVGKSRFEFKPPRDDLTIRMCK